MTLPGTPASTSISTNFVAVAGVSLAGLKTTAFPQTRAGKIFQVGIAIDVFDDCPIPVAKVENHRETPPEWAADPSGKRLLRSRVVIARAPPHLRRSSFAN